MSNKVLNAVFEHSRSRGAARSVLLALADRADDRGQSWCSAADIARRSGLASIGQVWRHLRALEKARELRIEHCRGGRAADGRGYVNTYTVTVPTVAQSTGLTVAQSTGLTDAHSRTNRRADAVEPSRGCSRTVAQAPHKPIGNPVGNPQETTPPTPQRGADRRRCAADGRRLFDPNGPAQDRVPTEMEIEHARRELRNAWDYPPGAGDELLSRQRGWKWGHRIKHLTPAALYLIVAALAKWQQEPIPDPGGLVYSCRWIEAADLALKAPAYRAALGMDERQYRRALTTGESIADLERRGAGWSTTP